MASFREWWVGKLITALQLDAGMRTFARAVGDSADACEVSVDTAVKQRFPEKTSNGGLAALGDERGLSRPFGGTDAAYGLKLKQAWDIWPKAGTPFGLLKALYDDGYVNSELVSAHGRHITLDGTQSSIVISDQVPWTFSTTPSFWNWFALIIRPTFPSGGVPLITDPEGVRLLATIEKWRFAHAAMKQLVWIPSGLTWDTFPAGATWDSQGRATWDSNLATPTVWNF